MWCQTFEFKLVGKLINIDLYTYRYFCGRERNVFVQLKMSTDNESENIIHGGNKFFFGFSCMPTCCEI